MDRRDFLKSMGAVITVAAVTPQFAASEVAKHAGSSLPKDDKQSFFSKFLGLDRKEFKNQFHVAVTVDKDFVMNKAKKHRLPYEAVLFEAIGIQLEMAITNQRANEGKGEFLDTLRTRKDFRRYQNDENTEFIIWVTERDARLVGDFHEHEDADDHSIASIIRQNERERERINLEQTTHVYDAATWSIKSTTKYKNSYGYLVGAQLTGPDKVGTTEKANYDQW